MLCILCRSASTCFHSVFTHFILYYRYQVWSIKSHTKRNTTCLTKATNTTPPDRPAYHTEFFLEMQVLHNYVCQFAEYYTRQTDCMYYISNKAKCKKICPGVLLKYFKTTILHTYWIEAFYFIFWRQITLRIVVYHFPSRLTATLNLCLIYFKITWAPAKLL